MLLSHIYNDSAAKFGIKVQTAVGAESQHTLHMILEAGDSQKVDEFMTLFAQMGSVEVTTGITCEAIVARGRC
ncbi:MAG: sulfite oxidase [Chloroflexi bacterium]|nr:sulfite oxidase [Chloroflexota bacterium]